MNSSKQTTQKIKQVLSNEAKKGANKYIISRIKKLEEAFLKISWIFFILGLVIFSSLSILILFIVKVITDGEAAVTYNAVFIGLIIALFIGIFFGFVWKTIEYKKLKKKFESIFRVEEFEVFK